MVSILDKTLANIVLEHPQAAGIFEKWELDFCCRGNRTLDDACRQKGIQSDVVEKDIALAEASGQPLNVADMSIDQLIGHIIENHHGFVRNSTPLIASHLEKVASRHGANHPEMVRARELFTELAIDLEQHMLKEEHVLFPRISMLATKSSDPVAPYLGHFFMDHPVKTMIAEHDRAGGLLEEIRTVTSGFTPPADACTTFKLVMQELDAYGRDLHVHVHLENNVLFPKALELEQKLGLVNRN